MTCLRRVPGAVLANNPPPDGRTPSDGGRSNYPLR